MSGPKTIIVVFMVFTLSLCIGPMTGNTHAEDGYDEAGIHPESFPEPAGVTSGKGVLKKFRFVTSDTLYHSTTSIILEQVPDMSLTFTTARKGTLVITYSAMVYTEPDGLEGVVAQVDGVNAAPGEVQFCGDTDEDVDGKYAKVHSFIWVKPDVPAGTHTVRMMWRSMNEIMVWTHRRTMIVQYKR